MKDEEETILSDGPNDLDNDYDPEDSFHRILGQGSPIRPGMNRSRLDTVQENVVPSFSVVISVERAMHLPRVSDKNR